MATFSGRVMEPKVQIGADTRLRPRSVFSAMAEAMASGSGSSCIRIRIRSAPSKCARTRSARARWQTRSRAGWIVLSHNAASETVVAPAMGRSSSRTTSTGVSGAASLTAARMRPNWAGRAATITGPRPPLSAWRMTAGSVGSPLSRYPRFAMPARRAPFSMR